MELLRGDWVKANTTGEVGKIIHISRLTFFVAIPVEGKEDRVAAFLESQLTKTDRPDPAGQGGKR